MGIFKRRRENERRSTSRRRETREEGRQRMERGDEEGRAFVEGRGEKERMRKRRELAGRGRKELNHLRHLTQM